MGVVYLAHDEKDGREVALKVLREAPPAEAARRMRREARAAKALDPARVAQVYEIGESPAGELYLVMEYVPGHTVREALRKRQTVDRPEALRIVRELAVTLGQAHAAGMVHRDVKPDNVMLADGGRVVLLDFGIVKQIDVGGDAAHQSTQLTLEGVAVGTPAYLAPEQALGSKVGPAADQFALAVMTYELLTGKLPWSATDVTRMLAQVLSETPPPPSSLNGGLLAGVDDVLARALAKQPEARFPSIEAFADALAAAERGTPASHAASPGLANASTSSPPVAHRRLATMSAMGALLLTALGASVAVRAWRDRKAAPPAVEALADLARPDGRLACAIFEARGTPDVSVRIGAAAASLACLRAKWYLGGGDERVLLPAALLNVAPQPSDDLGDPYAADSPEGDAVRAKTIDLARSMGSVYLDGVVKYERGAWAVVVTLRDRAAHEIARAQGQDTTELAVAVKHAVESLWKTPPVVARPLDPEVERWLSFPDVEIGLASADLEQISLHDEACATLEKRAAVLGSAFFSVAAPCRGNDKDPDAPALDESSPPAMLASAAALVALRAPALVPAEAARIAKKLDGFRVAEKLPLARSRLATTAGQLWALAHAPDLAHAAFLSAVREDPLSLLSWRELTSTAADGEWGGGLDRSSTYESLDAASRTASVWFPWAATFLEKAKSVRSDELDVRLREGRLAYLLEPNFVHAVRWGRALAEAGRADEARAVARTPVREPASLGQVAEPHAQPMIEAFSTRLEENVLAFLDLHDAKLARGLARLSGGGDVGLDERIVVSRVLGAAPTTATEWASAFLAAPDERAAVTARGYEATVVLCMNARQDLAAACLERVGRLAHQVRNSWGEGGEELLRGARRFVIGDVKGAVAAWGPLVAGPNWDIVDILPTEAFERAGEPELAARLDGRKMALRSLAGVSEAAPRVAKRALSRGDKAQAQKIAEQVVSAWARADVEVPAVAEMKEVLFAAAR